MAETNTRTKIFAPRQNSSAEPSVHAKKTSGLRFSLSIILLLTAVLVTGLAIGWTSFFPQSENIEISLATASKTPTGNLEMTGARYAGTTPSGMKFTIQASRAIESAQNRGVVRLFEADGFVEDNKEGKTTLSAKEALYDTTAKRLDMTGDVDIYQDQHQMRLTSQMMTAFMDKGELVTEMPVKLASPQLLLTAEGMHAKEHGDIILFKGKSRAQLKQ